MQEITEKPEMSRSITGLVGLIKKGDCRSLALLREGLGCSRMELAAWMSIPESCLLDWEENHCVPTPGQMALWRVKLSDYLNGKICMLLKTNDAELVDKLWDLLWRLA
jgi:DNA-binding transcriptional regulator YiaG